MRFKELYENQPVADKLTKSYNENDISKILDFMDNNCQPWLETVGQNPSDYYVYRGMREDSVMPSQPFTSFIKTVRKDREPKDSSLHKHHLMNRLIDAFELSANRTNSIFVSGKRGIADEYGDIYVAMPIGEFNYTWSPLVADWYDDSEVDKILTNPKYYSGTLIPDFVDEAAKKAIDSLRSLINTNQGQNEIGKQKLIKLAYGEMEEKGFLSKDNIISDMKGRNLQIKIAELLIELIKKDPYEFFINMNDIKEKLLAEFGQTHLVKWPIIDTLSYFRTLANQWLRKIFQENPDGLRFNEKVREAFSIKGDDGSLTDAIQSNHEIMIEAESMFYIDPELYEIAVGEYK